MCKRLWNGWHKMLKKQIIKVTDEIIKNGDERVLRLHFEWSPGQLTGVVCFKVHFPQYVSVKSGQPAANVITANKSCNISQRFLCYISQKVYTYSFPLTKVGVRIDIISLFNIWSRNNVCSATIKCNYITFISFAFLFYNMEQVLEFPCVSTTLKHNNIFLIVLGRCDGLCSIG